MIRKYFSLLVIITALAVFLQESASADLGPKPTMKFNIIYETTGQIKLMGGEQIECEDALCVGSKPLGNYGPQGFACQEDVCSSLAYGYSPYQKLVLHFSDKTRESNIFSTKIFDAEFSVKVTDNELIVQGIPPAAVTTVATNTPITQGGKFSSFTKAFIITLLLELLVSLIYLSVKKITKRVLVSVAISNLISLPLVWFLFPLIQLPSLMVMATSELFAILFEAYFIYLLNKQIITFKQSMVLSVLNNLVSLFIGSFILVSLGYLV
jgi:hypothetical protein